jgi:acetoin utilization deacetylase AcuC-like enzyme
VESVATKSHFVSAGGAIRSARLVMERTCDRAFALIRPPGHHAMKTVHGSRGFCNINIEAVMIEWIREKYGPKRVAIVDTDCHHGDGTQDIYWHDPDTLFISLHQDGRTLYPGTGFPSESGGPNARGRTINIPLPPRTSDEGFMMVMDRVVMPILEDFKPDLIVNSAGQDNHYTDPITNMSFSAQGYAALTTRLKPHIAVLEGGYSIQGALPYVNLGIALALAGMDYGHVLEPDFDPDRLRQPPKVTEYIENLCAALPKIYFEPPKHKLPYGEFDARPKDVFYDTDNISETQLESIMVCRDCPGVLKIDTCSTANPLSLGIEIPQRACDHCVDVGHQLLEEAQHAGGYRYMQFIDRRNKEYLRFGY